MADLVVARVVFDRFPSLRAEVEEAVERVVMKAALDVEAGAKQRVPVRTGHLKNSLQTTQTGKHSAVVGTAVRYAPYVEFGTRKQSPKPYLGPAAEHVRPAFKAALERVLK